MTVASDSVPSWKITVSFDAPATTCRLVRMMPLSTITTPVPTPIPLPMSGWPSGIAGFDGSPAFGAALSSGLPASLPGAGAAGFASARLLSGTAALPSFAALSPLPPLPDLPSGALPAFDASLSSG